MRLQAARGNILRADGVRPSEGCERCLCPWGAAAASRRVEEEHSRPVAEDSRRRVAEDSHRPVVADNRRRAVEDSRHQAVAVHCHPAVVGSRRREVGGGAVTHWW